MVVKTVFTVLVRSSGEPAYDYLIVSNLYTEYNR